MILPYLIKGFEVPTPAVKMQLIDPATNVKADGLARIDSGADIIEKRKKNDENERPLF